MSGTTSVRVRYCECDPMGVAHHSAYAPWLEVGRTELLRTTGVSYARLESEGTYLVVVALELTFRRPALYDDVLEIRTSVHPGGRVKIEHRYEVALARRERVSTSGRAGALAASASDGEILAAGRSVLACVGHDGTVRPLPPWLTTRAGGTPAS